MSSPRSWAAYPSSYRAPEIAVLAGWIRAGESGSLIGLAGAGKSNLLGFLCHRFEVVRSHWPDGTLRIVPVLVDLNSLPGNDLATFYRAILRALYEARAQLSAIDGALSNAVETLYRRVEDKTDPFLSQSALREALLTFQETDLRLVLVYDPFDSFCQTATLQVLDNMRGLRDGFKTTLSYIVGLRRELDSLRDPMEMGALYDILDAHCCWLGAMETQDARWVIRQVGGSTGRSFTRAEIERLVEVSGGYPSLLRAASLWLAGIAPPPEAEVWIEHLMAEQSVRHRLEEVWAGLTAGEQRALSGVQRQRSASPSPTSGQSASRQRVLDEAFEDIDRQHPGTLARLTAAGLCRQAENGWYICSDLVAAYVKSVEGEKTDRIWMDEDTGEVYRGQTALTNLSPLERELLVFFVRHPQTRHTKTDLILNAWPDDPCPLERSDDSVYQVIRGLRRKIESVPSKPRHIITWRGAGAQEGGYQFFPRDG